MQKNKIVLDLETQKSFDEVGGRKMHLLRVSVVGIYSYLNDKYAAFEEKQVPELEKILKSADLIIGSSVNNTASFDFLCHWKSQSYQAKSPIIKPTKIELLYRVDMYLFFVFF